jgi:hypothetical protein
MPALRKYTTTVDPAVLRVQQGPITEGTVVEFESDWAIIDPSISGHRYLFMGLDLHCEYTPKVVPHYYNLSLYQTMQLALDGKNGAGGTPVTAYGYDTPIWHVVRNGADQSPQITHTSDITTAYNFLVGVAGTWDYIRLRFKVNVLVGTLNTVIAEATKIEMYTHDGSFEVGTQVFPA